MSEEIKTSAPPKHEIEQARYRRATYKICKDCGRMFVMADNDVVFFVNKYGSVPLRCPDCREKRRVANPYYKKDEQPTEERKEELNNA